MKQLKSLRSPFRLIVPLTLIFLALACRLPGTSYPQDLQLTSTVETAPTTAQSASPEGTIPPESPTGIPPTATNLPDTPTPSNTPTTSSPTEKSFSGVRLAVIGDYGLAGPAEGDVANLIKSWGVDYILTTGDNNYPTGSYESIDVNIGQYFHEYISPYNGSYGAGAVENRFFPTLGNHDYDTEDAQPYFDYFTLPGNERYYDVVLGTVHLFAVNSDWREPDGVGRSSIQAGWLQAGLASSTSPWKLVVFHATPYSSGWQGSTDWMRWPYQEWGATAVVAGHDHLYERLEINGFPYFTNGLGGGAIYTFEAPIPGSQVRYNTDYGAMLIVAGETQITFQFMNRAGDVIDTYQINR